MRQKLLSLWLLFAAVLLSFPCASFAQEENSDADEEALPVSESINKIVNEEYPSLYDEMSKKPSNEGDKDAWFRISKTTNKKELLEFMDSYPNSEYTKEALARIDEIDTMDAKQMYREMAGKKYEHIPPEITEDALNNVVNNPSPNNQQGQGQQPQQQQQQQKRPRKGANGQEEQGSGISAPPQNLYEQQTQQRALYGAAPNTDNANTFGADGRPTPRDVAE